MWRSRILEKEIDKTMDDLGIEPGSSGDMDSDDGSNRKKKKERETGTVEASEEYDEDVSLEESEEEDVQDKEEPEEIDESDEGGEDVPEKADANTELLNNLCGSYYLEGTVSVWLPPGVIGRKNGMWSTPESRTAAIDVTAVDENVVSMSVVFSTGKPFTCTGTIDTDSGTVTGKNGGFVVTITKDGVAKIDMDTDSVKVHYSGDKEN